MSSSAMKRHDRTFETPQGHQREAQEWPLEVAAVIPLALARDDVPAAVAAAERLLPHLERLAAVGQGMDAAVAALIEGGRHDDALKVIDASERHLLPGAAPYLTRMKARLLLASGDAPAAVDMARESAAGFADAGYRLKELKTRVLMAAWGSEKTSRDWQGGHLHNRLPRRRRSIP
jgi:hypothetical protein